MVNNNSEILLITDCTNANPNGNPDAENNPRMDEDTEKILVSDVRVKRYIRDNLLSKGYDIFVSKEIDEKTGKIKSVKAEDKTKKYENSDVRDCIDVRLFGGVFTVKKNNFNYTGPVQFGWGSSMHKVIVSDHGITTTFKTSDSGNDSTGSMGRDKRVDYALISMQGRINANSSKYTNLSEDDVKILDDALVNLYSETNTRSKIGQTVRLYLRVETQRGVTLKNLEEYVFFVSDLEYPKSLNAGFIDAGELLKYLNKKKDIIASVKIFIDDKIAIKSENRLIELDKEIEKLGIVVDRLEG